jgi:hypothetical protein
MSLRGDIRCVLNFSIIIFLQGILYISPPPVHLYIQAFSPQINTSDIPNNMHYGTVLLQQRMFMLVDCPLCLKTLRSRTVILSLNKHQSGFQPQRIRWASSRTCCEYSPGTARNRHERYQQQPQNVDLPELQPKKKKKPFLVPIKKMVQESRRDKRLAEMRIEKPLEPPKNGLLVPELVPVAYEVLDNWKLLIQGLSQLLNVVTVYGCR